MDNEGTTSGQVADKAIQGVIANLKDLRTGPGCTPERLRASPLITAIKNHLKATDASPDVDKCLVELKRLIDGLGDARMREALLVALGFSDSHVGNTLRERRENYLKSQSSSSRMSLKTLTRWEDRSINFIASQVCDTHHDRLKAIDPLQSEDNPEIPRKINDLETVKHSNIYFYSEDGVLHRTQTTRRVRAVRDMTRATYRTESSYLTENRPGLMEINASFGCKIETQAELAGGTVITTYRLYRDFLSPGDGVYPFGFETFFNGSRTTDPVVWWLPEFPGAQYEVVLNFHPRMRPSRAWWFVDTTPALGQIEPDVREGRHLELFDNGCYAFKYFDDMRANLSHGIAWLWGRNEL